jgi:hypothetical protein
MGRTNKRWTDDRVFDVIHELIELAKAGIIPTEINHTTFREVGGDVKKLSHYFRENRTAWAEKMFPSSEGDRLGFYAFVDLLNQFAAGEGIEFTSTKRDLGFVNRFTWPESKFLSAVEGQYHDGRFTREQAVDVLKDNGFKFGDGDSRIEKHLPLNGTNGGNNGDSLEGRIRSLRGSNDEIKLRKVKGRNPYFHYGDVYQNLVGTAIRLAHLDDRVYSEVPMTMEMDESGNPAITRDIVDYLVMDGYDKKKRKRKDAKDRSIILYEVKLGRQRQGLREQVEKQLEAAKARGYENVRLKLVLGTPGDHYIRSGENEKLTGDLLRRSEESLYELESAREIFNDMPEVEIVSLSTLLKKACGELESRRKLSTEKGLRDLDTLVEESSESKLKLTLGEDKKTVLEYFANFRDLQGKTDNVLTYAFSVLSSKLNEAIQSRRISFDESEYYDEQLYLLNEFLGNPNFKRKLTDSIMKGECVHSDDIFGELNKIIYGIADGIGYNIETDKELIPEGRLRKAHNAQVKIANLYNGTLGRIFGKIKCLDYEEHRQRVQGMTTEEFWSQFMPNVEEILEGKDRNTIYYPKEKKGKDDLFTEFKRGKRVFSNGKIKKNQWILDELNEFGIEVGEINIEDRTQLEKCVDLLTQLRGEAEVSIDSLLESRRRSLGDKIDSLESIVDVREFGKKRVSNSKLSVYMDSLERHGLGDYMSDVPGLFKRLKRDKIVSALTGGIDLVRSIKSLFSNRKLEKLGDLKNESLIQKSASLDFAMPKNPSVYGHARAFTSYLMNFLRRNKRESELDRIHEIYKEFTDLEKPVVLVDVEKSVCNYLDRANRLSIEDKTGIRRSYEVSMEGSLKDNSWAQAVVRNQIFGVTHTAERYTAAKILHAVAKAKAVREFDADAGKRFLDLSRRELKFGRDLGSEQIVNDALGKMRSIYSDPDELKAHYNLAA